MALVGVVAVATAFVSVARYTREVASQVGPRRPVLELTRDVPAYGVVSEADVRVVRVPERFVSPTSVGDVAALEDRVAGVALLKGSYLQRSDLVSPPGASPSQRVISLVVDLESGVAGQLDPEDHVDVIAAGPLGRGDRLRARTVVQGVEVLTAQPVDGGAATVPPVGLGSVVQGGRADGGEEEAGRDGRLTDEAPATIAVTLAVSPAQARAIVLADTTASSTRLALVPRTAPSGDVAEEVAQP